MNKRPPTITALAVLYMVVGLVSTSYHFSEFKTLPLTFLSIIETFLMFVIGALAVVAGYYMLRGKNWARWLALAWTIFHVLISAFESPWGVIFHGAFVLLLWLLLFSKESNEWFKPSVMPVPEPPVPLPDLPPPPADVPPPPPDAPQPPAM
jgi:hypothetical protein